MSLEFSEDVFMLVIPNFTALGSEHVIYMTPGLQNMLKLILWPAM